MSLFDVIGDIFSGFDAGDVVNTAVQVGGTLIAANQQAEAQEAAAQRVAEAEAARAEQIRQANAAAQARFDTQMQLAQPGVSYLRQVTANPMTLTPEQERLLEQTRRTTANAVSRSGLRGSGRAITAAIRDGETAQRSQFIDQNLRRADQAATGLANQFFTADNNAINTNINTADKTGAGGIRSAQVQGQAQIDNQRLTGQAMGDIASIIASQDKERGRDSRYQEERNKLKERI